MTAPVSNRVLALFRELDSLSTIEAHRTAAVAIEDHHPEIEALTVGGIVSVLPTDRKRPRLPRLERAGINPSTRIGDLAPEERSELAEALRTGRAIRAAVIA